MYCSHVSSLLLSPSFMPLLFQKKNALPVRKKNRCAQSQEREARAPMHHPTHHPLISHFSSFMLYLESPLHLAHRPLAQRRRNDAFPDPWIPFQVLDPVEGFLYPITDALRNKVIYFILCAIVIFAIWMWFLIHTSQCFLHLLICKKMSDDGS